MKYLPILALFLAIFSCTRIEDHKPEIIKVEGELQPLSSSINLPLIVSISEIEDMINEKLEGEIYKDTDFEKDNMALSISKIGRIQISMEGNKLFYELPLHIWAEGHFEKKVALITVKKTQKLDFSAKIRFSTEIGINENWQAITKTTFLGITWVKKPSIHIAFLKISLDKLVEKKLEQKLPDMLAKLDGNIKQKLKLHDMAQKVWTSLQKPILVHKQFTKVWLVSRPKKFYMSHIEGKNGHIFINTRIEMEVATAMGEQAPGISHADTLLPSLLPLQDTSSVFNLNVLAKLPFDALNPALNEYIPKKKIEAQGYTVKLKEFEIMGSDSMLLLRVDVGGDIHGRVYLNGKPAYDTVNQVLSLQNFNFEAHSEEILLSTADWFLHDSFREKVQEGLYLPLGQRLEALPALIQGAISQSKLGKKVKVELKDMHITPRQILVTYKDAQMLINAQGRLHVSFE